MSSLLARVTAWDWKRVGLLPWEKYLLGMAGLVVLFCLSGTRWHQTTKTPAELAESARQSEELLRIPWPESQQRQFRQDDLSHQVDQRFFTAVDPRRFRLRVPFSPRLSAWQAFVDEPRWLPVEALLATSGRFILPLAADFALVEKPPLATENSSPDVRVRGVRYVAVRGLIPLQAQIEQIGKALHLDNPQQAAPLLEYLDFTLERQTAVAGPDPWAGNWQRLEIQSIFDIFQESPAPFSEIGPDEFFHPVLTMPLPAQFKGEWGTIGAHPLIPLRRVERQPAKFPGQQVPTPVVQHEPQLLLFRYFDFTVEPGDCYRYRVQLSLRNPNYERSLSQVRNGSIPLGETRETPFCLASVPVAIEQDTRYYLIRAGRSRNLTRTEAEFNIFQWDPQFGTTAGAQLKVAAGQRIGGKAKTQRLNAARSRLDLDEVVFASADILLDSFRSPRLDPTENNHPGWDVKRWKESADRGTFDQIVIMDRFGTLSGIDSISMRPELLREEQRLQAERQQWLQDM